MNSQGAWVLIHLLQWAQWVRQLTTLGSTNSPCSTHQRVIQLPSWQDGWASEMLSYPEWTTKTKFQAPILTSDFITNKTCWPTNLPIIFQWGTLSSGEILLRSLVHLSPLKLVILSQSPVMLTTHKLLEVREHVCPFIDLVPVPKRAFGTYWTWKIFVLSEKWRD